MSRTWLTISFLAGWLGLGNLSWAQPVNGPGMPALPMEVMAAGDNAFSDAGPPPFLDSSGVQFGVDILSLWFKPNRATIPLITLGDVNDPVPGAMGQPGTIVLYGNDNYGEGSNIAGRFSFAGWATEVLSFEANYWIMEQRSHIFAVGGTGDPGTTAVIARPYYNPTFSMEDSDPRVVPPTLYGFAQSQFTTRLMGAETNVRYYVTGEPRGTGFSLLAGARFLKLDEKYIGWDTAVERVTGTTYQFTDNITTYNEFVGGQLGVQFKWLWDRLSFEAQTKLALGPNFRRISYTGFSSVTTSAGAVTADNFGTYVQPSNRGIIRDQPLTVMPEFGFTFGWYLMDYLRLCGGYSFMYLAQVYRPGDQFDRVVNIQPLNAPAQVGPARPSQVGASNDFWVQWVNIGLELVF